MEIPAHNTFLIVGLGLMGGSYAMALQKRGYVVDAIDRDPAALAFAKERGLVRAGGGEADTPALLAGADTVVLALYPWDILPWLHTHAGQLKPGALVCDLAGVKGCFVHEAQALLAPRHEFLPCHPMAGREHSGIQYASDAVFTGANFLITPTARNTLEGIAFGHALAAALGFARVTELSVDEHDAMIAYVSQLTHVIAVCLMHANDDARLPEVTGDSFRDLTRIADINAGLWSGLFLANKDPLLARIDAFAAQLGRLRGYIAARDEDALAQMLAESARRRQTFNATNGGSKAE